MRQETESLSSRASRPRDSLDLSDSEIDFPHLQKEEKSVLVLDASHHTKSPDKAEVEVVLALEKSPVKVICHTAAGVQKQLRKSDDGHGHYKVSVKQVPHLSMSQDLSSQHPVISPRIVRESPRPVSGSEKVKESGHQASSQRKGESVAPARTEPPTLPKYPQPNFDDSQESDTSVKLSRPAGGLSETVLSDTDGQSVISEGDACSLHEYVTSNKKGPMKAKHPPKTSGKNKGGTIIPSRYMQSAMKTSKSLSSETSLLTVMGGKTSGSRSANRPSSAKKQKPKSEQRIRQVKTPIASQHAQAEKKTSTPTHEVPNIESHDIDASAIQAETSAISLADISQIKKDKKRLKSNTKKSDDVTQEDLDALYSRYLQCVYVNMMARKAFQSQERDAMAQLSGLWEMNEKLAAREAELKMDHVRLKHQNSLDDTLTVQESGLNPVVSSLDQVGKEYNNLADSLDTTRHQISTSGIYIPPDEDHFQERLEYSLQESEQLLGELSVMTRQATPHVKSFADALDTGKTTLQSQKLQMKECKEMLGACQSLVIQETSLKLQDITINSPEETSLT